MSTTILFIQEMIRRVPELKAIYSEHMNDNGELLPHVFMGDVARFSIKAATVTESSLSVKLILDLLEDGLSSENFEITTLILVSYVENLLGEQEAVRFLKPLMGHRLKNALKKMCL